jgi:CBS domain containing-hemolysin-like protein
MEATLYAVPLPHVRHMAESGARRGKILLDFKSNIQRPIAAILILNTAANTMGAAVAGWAVAQLYGESGLLIFSILFTLTILYCSEILPKVIGVVYSRQIAGIIAYPLAILIKLLIPLIAVSNLISSFLSKEAASQPKVSLDEVISMAALGTEEGALDRFEGSVITNVIGLDKLLVREVLTPRVVVFRLDQEIKLDGLKESIANWRHSRVPIFSESDPDHLTGYVNQRDIFRELIRGNTNLRLSDLARPLKAVPELMSVDKLLLQMFEEKEQICAVVDEHGGLAGIITMEDIIEEVVGREIVDEYDAVSDLRTFAQVLRFARQRKQQKNENLES